MGLVFLWPSSTTMRPLKSQVYKKINKNSNILLYRSGMGHILQKYNLCAMLSLTNWIVFVKIPYNVRKKET